MISDDRLPETQRFYYIPYMPNTQRCAAESKASGACPRTGKGVLRASNLLPRSLTPFSPVLGLLERSERSSFTYSMKLTALRREASCSFR